MNVVLNERIYAEGLLAENSLTTKPIEALTIIARYYLWVGHPKKEIARLLEEHLIRSDPKANIVKWRPIINRISKASDRYPLVQLESIPVTEAEIDSCQKVSGVQRQRLAFTMLCFAKFYNSVNPQNNGWVNKTDREVFSAANVLEKVRTQSLLVSDLWDAGLIEFSKKVDNVNSRVTFICDDSPVVLNVTDFRNLGNQYMMYMGHPYIECQSCGAVVRRVGKRKRFCRACAEENHRAQARGRYTKKAS